MKLESLLFQLKEFANLAEEHTEIAHLGADLALLEYINNPKVTMAYEEIVKFYEGVKSE